MMWVRKLLGGFFAVILFLSLLGAVSLANMNLSLGSPEKIKELAAESGAYEQLVATALDAAQKEQSSSQAVSLDDVIVQQAAKQAFPPAYIEQKANIIIDANFAWLQGKTDKPSFSVDLTDSKLAFAERVGAYVTDRLQKLPACTAEQEAQLKTPFDPINVTCLPSSVDPAVAGQSVTTELSQSSFLSQPAVTADSLGREPNSQEQPYYANLSSLPGMYQAGQKAPWALLVVALLAALAVIFLAPRRRNGWRNLSIVLLIVGLSLIVTKLLASFLADQASAQVTGSVASQLQQPRDDFIHQLASALVQLNLVVGITLTVVAIGILGYLHFSGRQKKVLQPEDFNKPEEPGSTIAPAPPKPRPTPTPTPTKKPAPQQSQPRKLGATYDRPATPQLRKRPPRPRGRDLIQ